VSVMIWNLLGF